MKAVFYTVVVGAFTLPLQATFQVLTPRLVKYIQHVVDDQQVPGATVAIARSDGSLEFGAWGVKSEDGDAAASDTVFAIASVSKAFTATAMGILIDDYAHGRNTTPLPAGVRTLDWDTKVTHLLPGEWVLADPWATEKANIQDILNHVSGMPRHDTSYGSASTPASVTRNLRNLRPAFELREQWTYNNQMYIVASYIISKLTGSFTEFVEDRIFKALNMTSTSYPTNDTLSSVYSSTKIAQGFTGFGGRRVPLWYRSESELQLVAGAGGITTTAEDMGKWLATLLNGGIDPRTNTTIIPPSAFTEITTAHSIEQGSTDGQSLTSIVGYGLGFSRTSVDGHDIINHDGGIPGFSSLLTAVLSDGVGVVVLANADSKGAALTDITLAVAASLLESNTTVLDPRRRSLPVKQAVFHSARADSSPPNVDFTGAYASPGYPAVHLCSVTSTSKHCRDVLKPFEIIDAVAPPTPDNVTTLYTAFESFWTSHARLIFNQGTQYYVDPTYLFPTGYGKNTTPFETGVVLPGYLATGDFVVDAQGKVVGFGLSGTVPDAPTDRARAGGSIEQTADVWFDKV